MLPDCGFYGGGAAGGSYYDDDDDDDEEDEDETEFSSFVSPTAAFVVALGILPFFVDDDAFEIFNWITIGSPKSAREASMEVIIVNSDLRILLFLSSFCRPSSLQQLKKNTVVPAS